MLRCADCGRVDDYANFSKLIKDCKEYKIEMCVCECGGEDIEDLPERPDDIKGIYKNHPILGDITTTSSNTGDFTFS